MSPATPLAGDVPPRHLMSPVHSSSEWRLDHPVGDVSIHSTSRQYARAAAYIVLIMTHALPRKQSRDINTIWTTDIMALGDLLGDTGIGYFYNVFPPVLLLGPHVGAQHPCTCSP
jgi:hypothetical protein